MCGSPVQFRTTPAFTWVISNPLGDPGWLARSRTEYGIKATGSCYPAGWLRVQFPLGIGFGVIECPGNDISRQIKRLDRLKTNPKFATVALIGPIMMTTLRIQFVASRSVRNFAFI